MIQCAQRVGMNVGKRMCLERVRARLWSTQWLCRSDCTVQVVGSPGKFLEKRILLIREHFFEPTCGEMGGWTRTLWPQEGW